MTFHNGSCCPILKHLIQYCPAKQGFLFLNFTMLSTQSPSNDPLEAKECVFNLALQMVGYVENIGIDKG